MSLKLDWQHAGPTYSTFFSLLLFIIPALGLYSVGARPPDGGWGKPSCRVAHKCRGPTKPRGTENSDSKPPALHHVGFVFLLIAYAFNSVSFSFRYKIFSGCKTLKWNLSLPSVVLSQ